MRRTVRQGFEPSQPTSLIVDGVALLANATRKNESHDTSDFHCGPHGTPGICRRLGNVVATTDRVAPVSAFNALADEEWRPVPGFPKYEVSSRGRVRSRVNPSKPKLLKPALSGKGPAKYLSVSLSRNGRSFTRLAHQLVLEAFEGARPANAVSRHLDGDRMNCCVTNLRWGTRKQNMNDRRNHGRGADGERNVNAKLRFSQVMDIRRRTLTKSDVKQLAIELGVRPAAIWSVVKGKSWR